MTKKELNKLYNEKGLIYVLTYTNFDEIQSTKLRNILYELKNSYEDLKYELKNVDYSNDIKIGEGDFGVE